MSTIPLTQPLKAQLTTQLLDTAEAEAVAARESIIAKYGLGSSLVGVDGNGAVVGTGTLTRASTSTVDLYTGGTHEYQINEPAFNGVPSGNSIGLNFGSAVDDLQLPTTGWLNNDFWMYFNFPLGIGVTGSNQTAFLSQVDSDNKLDIIALTSNSIRFRRRTLAVTYLFDVAYTLGSGPLDFLITMSSSTGMQAFLSNGNSNNNGNTANTMFGSTAFIGSTSTLTSPTQAFNREFKFAAGTTTLEAARNA